MADIVLVSAVAWRYGGGGMTTYLQCFDCGHVEPCINKEPPDECSDCKSPMVKVLSSEEFKELYGAGVITDKTKS